MIRSFFGVQKQQQPICMGCGSNDSDGAPFQHQSIRNIDPSSSPPDPNPHMLVKLFLSFWFSTDCLCRLSGVLLMCSATRLGHCCTIGQIHKVLQTFCIFYSNRTCQCTSCQNAYLLHIMKTG